MSKVYLVQKQVFQSIFLLFQILASLCIVAALAEPEAEAQNYYRSLVTGRDYYRPNPSTKYEAVSPYYGFDTQYQGYTY